MTDSDGTALPGAPASVARKTHLEAAEATMTDIEGNYRFRLLPPAGDCNNRVN